MPKEGGFDRLVPRQVQVRASAIIDMYDMYVSATAPRVKLIFDEMYLN
jgi:hypothetical protein